MNEHPIQGLMSTSMQSIKEMVDVNTIVGEAVEAPDGTVIIPVSKVGFGFVAAGSEYNQKSTSEIDSPMFGGGSGGGVSIKPVGFLVVGQGQIKLLPVEGATSTPMDRLLEYVPELIDKVNEKMQKSKEDKHTHKEAKAKAEFERNVDQEVKSATEE
jgi:sporulation protein YtfJ